MGKWLRLSITHNVRLPFTLDPAHPYLKERGLAPEPVATFGQRRRTSRYEGPLA